MKEFRWSHVLPDEALDPQKGHGSMAVHDLMRRFYELLFIQNQLQQSLEPVRGINREDYENMVFDFLVQLGKGLIGNSDHFEMSAYRQYIRAKAPMNDPA